MKPNPKRAPEGWTPWSHDDIQHWAGVCHGAVLEVGLGVGELAAEIAARPEVTRHVIIEREQWVLDEFPAPATAEVHHQTFPTWIPEGEFNVVALDIGRDWEYIKILGYAVRLLVDGGIVLTRR